MDQPQKKTGTKVRANWSEIERALQKKGWTRTQLLDATKSATEAGASRMSWTTLAKLEAGFEVEHYIISRVAIALGVPRESLLLRELRQYRILDKSTGTWTVEDHDELLKRLENGLPPGGIEIKGLEDEVNEK